jgi:hypothetical protein
MPAHEQGKYMGAGQLASDEEQAWAELKKIVECLIAESSAGAVSRKTFDGIVDEELRGGGDDAGRG